MSKFTKDAAMLVMERPKNLLGAPSWTVRQNHAGSKILVAQFVDEEGITIPGLSMLLEVRAPAVVDSCLFLFSLMQRGTPHEPRLYQLEVCPVNKPSHRGPEGFLYGPHEHVGDETASLAGMAGLGMDCSNWDFALTWFLMRTKVSNNGPYTVPQP
ncbi:hypothetical protein GCM10007320_61470 [Pseudorhodoferax aquiterrae]|uniref:Uncharacterized protein n=2 Tax=Pseudorhodoferax aquiterrae TaxID=747304 RepID=A0ABQ3GEN6_9BURK|nr:hypothetical protein GCM10007320_61470 [Pseudorhodoferax aquiterrae]